MSVRRLAGNAVIERADEQERRLQTKECRLASFEYWYALGVRRSWTRVAERFNTHAATVAHWAREDGWRAKARIRDRKLLDEIGAELGKSFLARRLELVKLVRGQIAHYEDRVRSAMIGPEKVSDLEKLIRLELDLAGMSSSLEILGNSDGTQDYDRMVLELTKANGDSKSLIVEKGPQSNLAPDTPSDEDEPEPPEGRRF